MGMTQEKQAELSCKKYIGTCILALRVWLHGTASACPGPWVPPLVGEAGGEEREDRVEVCPQFLRDSACPLLGPGTLRQTVQVSVPAGPSFTSSIHVSNIKATEKTER